MRAVEKAYLKGVKVSERHGAGEWLAERISSIVLIPLTLWALWGAWTVAGAGYEAARDWASQPVNAILLGLTLLAVAWHLNMGLKVIVDDYIHRPSSRGALLAANLIFCVLLAAAGVFFIARLALGSAPLPAGLGA